MKEEERKGWMIQIGRGRKERMDDPNWEKRKGKDGWSKVGEEEGKDG